MVKPRYSVTTAALEVRNLSVISATVATLSAFGMRRLLPDISKSYRCGRCRHRPPETFGEGAQKMTNAPCTWARGVRMTTQRGLSSDLVLLRGPPGTFSGT